MSTPKRKTRNARPQPVAPVQKDPVKKKIKDLEFLIESSHLLNSTLDYDRLLGLIMKIVRDALDVETVSILFPDAAGKNMVFELARGKRDRDLVGLKVPLGQGVVGWVAKHKRPLIVNDLKNDKRYSLHLEKGLGLKTRSIVSIPLLLRNKLIGVLEAVNRRDDDPFTKDDLEIFLALGDHIATAIDNARLYREAERERLENQQLYELSMLLGKGLTLDDVLNHILNSLAKILPFDAAAIFVLDRKNQQLVSHIHRGYAPGREEELHLKLDEGIVGWAAQHKKGEIVADTSTDPRYVDARARTRSEMVAPMLSRGAVIGLFNLESNRKRAYTADDLRLLETFAAQAGVSIERATLYEEQQVKQELEGELKIARTVQQFFTPTRSRKLGPFTLVGRNYPSLELSGDYYDVFPLRKPYVAFAVADVAGKGVPASIIMAAFRATLHTAGPYFTHARDIANRANTILIETVRPSDFVTAFIGVINTDTAEITYCSAGHEPGILMRPDGSYRLLQDGGTILGVLDDNELDEGSFFLDDEMLFCYTDGVVDATSPAGEPFGFDRLVLFLRENRHMKQNELCTALGRHIKDYVGKAPLTDDVTFLVLRK